MEDNSLKYDILIKNLRNTKPVLNNPEELTEKVMLSVKTENSKFIDLIILVRPWVSAAAIFLIALFIYQNNDIPLEKVNKPPVANIKEKPEPTDCLAGIRSGKIDRKTLLRSYQCYQKQSEERRSNTEQLMMKYQQKF